MTKFKLIAFAGILVTGAAVSLFILHRTDAAFRANDVLLQQQAGQLAELTAEHERLSHLATRGEKASATDHTAELAKLRLEAEALKKQMNDLIPQLKQDPGLRPSQPAPNPVPHTPEYWAQLHQMAGNKTKDAMILGMGFMNYALDHQNKYPSNFDQIAPYLAKNHMSLSGTNQFDIVYQGSLDDLEGVPLQTVAVIRDQQIWQGPDGRAMRVYGLADGSSQIVSADDNFQTWEAKHIISPPNVIQSGR